MSLWLIGPAAAGASGLPDKDEVAAAVVAIERTCGAPIKRTPKFELVPGGRLRCWYDPASHTIRLASEIGRVVEQAASNRDELAKYRRLLLFHELVHAWQYQQLPIAEVLHDGIDRRVLAAILEGHAMLCEETYAEEIDAVELAQRMHVGARGAPSIELPDGVFDVHFRYHEGKRFVLAAAGPKPSRDAMVSILRALPTQVEILNPNEYLKRTPELAFYAAAIERERAVEIADVLEQLRQGLLIEGPWTESELKVADIAAYLRRLPSGQRDTEALSRSARYGLRMTTVVPESTITIIGLTDADRAHRVRMLLERQLVRAGGRRCFRSTICPPGVCRSQWRIVPLTTDADSGGQAKTTTSEIALYRIGQYVVEVTERLVEETSPAQQENGR